jgi:hypothetical protein
VQLQISTVPARIDNEECWEEIAKQIEAESGLPTQVTPQLVSGMISSVVPLLYQADAAKDMGLLRGTFTDALIAQRQRIAGCLQGARPILVVADLIGTHMDDGHPTIRAKLSIRLTNRDGGESVANEFWDLRLGDTATVSQANCPNCGAPMGQGELICGHCGTDARSVVTVPLVVSRLELY